MTKQTDSRRKLKCHNIVNSEVVSGKKKPLPSAKVGLLTHPTTINHTAEGKQSIPALVNSASQRRVQYSSTTRKAFVDQVIISLAFSKTSKNSNTVAI